jgi:hypothetical protein
VWAAHVRIAVIDAGDPSTQNRLEGEPGAFGFG